jgi:hypothetical protein
MTDVHANAPRAGERSMGRKVPNLLIVYDSEKGSEFRVQCEMGLPDEAEAARLKEDVLKGTPEALERAKERVMARIDLEATPAFKKIVSEAFDENIRVRTERPRR